MKKGITKAVFALFMLTGLSGCASSDTQEKLITVDMKANYPEKELVVQDFLDVEYIPLETNDEFITQGSVKAIGEQYILVTNRINDGNIFVFDRKTGKGIRVINRLGQGAEEYASINGIVLDEAKEEILVNSTSAKKVLVYDLLGNFKRSFPHAQEAEYMEMFDYDKDNLICYDMTGSHKDNEKRNKPFYHALISKQDGSVRRGIVLPFDIIKAPRVRQDNAVAVAWIRAIAPDRGNWLLGDTSSDTLYRYMPEKDKPVPFIVKKPTENPDVLFSAGVSTDRYCFLQGTEKKFNFEKMRGFSGISLVYDYLEKAFFKPVVLNADYDQDRVDLYSRLGNGQIAAHNNLAADQLVEAYQKNKLKGKLKEIAAGLDEEANPILMLLKYRK